MTLTPADLQAIKHLFDDRFDAIEKRLDKLEIRLTGIERQMKYMVRLYMEDIPNHEDRIGKIENRLNLSENP